MAALVVRLILPLAQRWVDAHQARILEQGVALTRAQQCDAERVGVKDCGRVRLMPVNIIPTPADFLLRRLSRFARILSGDTAGITFGHGIYIRADLWHDRELIVHELAHVAQYERYGGTAAFLRDYLSECLTVGYPNGPLEREAIARTGEVCC